MIMSFVVVVGGEIVEIEELFLLLFVIVVNIILVFLDWFLEDVF